MTSAPALWYIFEIMGTKMICIIFGTFVETRFFRIFQKDSQNISGKNDFGTKRGEINFCDLSRKISFFNFHSGAPIPLKMPPIRLSNIGYFGSLFVLLWRWTENQVHWTVFIPDTSSKPWAVQATDLLTAPQSLTHLDQFSDESMRQYFGIPESLSLTFKWHGIRL